ncbi:hypothetical protein CIW47_13315 [Mycolicibacterium sp. P1-5]|nr:hypothetical protein CIW47_13315 [Mycolicibacterium sp. P1-5]
MSWAALGAAKIMPCPAAAIVKEVELRGISLTWATSRRTGAIAVGFDRAVGLPPAAAALIVVGDDSIGVELARAGRGLLPLALPDLLLPDVDSPVGPDARVTGPPAGGDESGDDGPDPGDDEADPAGPGESPVWAEATGVRAAIAMPAPSATARAPTRPTYRP